MSSSPVSLPKSVLPLVGFLATLLLILSVFWYVTALKAGILFSLLFNGSLTSGTVLGLSKYALNDCMGSLVWDPGIARCSVNLVLATGHGTTQRPRSKAFLFSFYSTGINSMALILRYPPCHCPLVPYFWQCRVSLNSPRDPSVILLFSSYTIAAG